MELYLLLMFSTSTGFPIFHLVTIQQWHLTSWSTSSVLAEGCSWKKCSNAPRCSKGATCWSWNIPFWKVPVNKNMIDWVKTSTISMYSICNYLQGVISMPMNSTCNQQQPQRFHPSHKSKPWSVPKVGIQTHSSYAQGKISEINRLVRWL